MVKINYKYTSLDGENNKTMKIIVTALVWDNNIGDIINDYYFINIMCASVELMRSWERLRL